MACGVQLVDTLVMYYWFTNFLGGHLTTNPQNGFASQPNPHHLGSQTSLYLSTMPTMSGRVRPIEKFAEAVGKCSVEVGNSYKHNIKIVQLTQRQAAAYGKCIVADYQFVEQDMCAKEFAKLKDCYLVSCLLSSMMDNLMY